MPRTYTEEQRRKVGDRFRNKPKTATHKAKIARQLTGRPCSPTTRENISAGHKRRKDREGQQNEQIQTTTDSRDGGDKTRMDT